MTDEVWKQVPNEFTDNETIYVTQYGKIKNKNGFIKLYKGPKGKHKNPEKLIKCPHCDIIGRASNLKRWHFKNCKKHNK